MEMMNEHTAGNKSLRDLDNNALLDLEKNIAKN